MVEQIDRDPSTQRVQDALVALEEFAEIRQIVSRYFGPDKGLK